MDIDESNDGDNVFGLCRKGAQCEQGQGISASDSTETHPGATHTESPQVNKEGAVRKTLLDPPQTDPASVPLLWDSDLTELTSDSDDDGESEVESGTDASPDFCASHRVTHFFSGTDSK
jgi:hypothetical protein